MTTIATQNPVRSDVIVSDPLPTDTSPQRRGWSVAGIGAGLAGAATIVTTSAVGAVYDKDLVGHPAAIAAKLEDQAGFLFAFHSIAVVGALLMVVFAAGLYRRLRTALPESSLPLVAFAGLLGTAVVSVLGSGLDTEFMMTFATGDSADVDPANAAMYNHWIGTIPWVWVLAGLAGLSLHLAARRLAVPRWIGRVGLVLGGLTVVLGVSPLEYMAGVTGALLVLVTGIGFTVGDKAFRNAR